MLTATVALFCSDCRAERPFEVPPCADGHGADCPDLACTVCGSAVVVGDVLVEEVEALPQPRVA